MEQMMTQAENAPMGLFHLTFGRSRTDLL